MSTEKMFLLDQMTLRFFINRDDSCFFGKKDKKSNLSFISIL